MWIPRPQQLTKGPDKLLSVWCGDCLKTEAKWGGDQDLTKKPKNETFSTFVINIVRKRLFFILEITVQDMITIQVNSKECLHLYRELTSG